MDIPVERFFDYPRLSAAERDEIDAYVAANPHLRSQFDEFRMLGELFNLLEQEFEQGPSDDLLAYYVIRRHLMSDPGKADLAVVFDKLDAAVASRPDVHERYQSMVRRLEEITSQSEASPEHFNRLNRGEPSQGDGSGESEVRSGPVPVPGMWRRSLGLAAAAIILVFAAYGGLRLVGDYFRPANERLAALENHFDDAAIFQRTTRGGSTEDPVTAYVAAIAVIEKSHRSYGGLFRHYDHDQLRTVVPELKALSERSHGDTYLQLQSLLVLGKVHLVLGNETEAARAMETVARTDSLAWPEAPAILRRLRAN